MVSFSLLVTAVGGAELSWPENSASEPASARSAKAAKFASNVAFHVVLHEIGHALVREFDLPILGNEETLADAFATHYLTAHCGDRALAVLKARVQSLMVEAGEVARAEWPVRGEHNSDARRAYQIAALAVAADRERYRPIAELVEMSDADVRSSADYGAEIHRSWRRVLAPLRMPEGQSSREAGVRGDDSKHALIKMLRKDKVIEDLEQILRGFDWHSFVALEFVEGEGGAGWSRSSRRIRVHTEYLQRFVDQSRLVK